jgi:hypothetical protein
MGCMFVCMVNDRVAPTGGMPLAGVGVLEARGAVGFADRGIGRDGRKHACERGARCQDPAVGATQSRERSVACLAGVFVSGQSHRAQWCGKWVCVQGANCEIETMASTTPATKAPNSVTTRPARPVTSPLNCAEGP